jgi:5-methylcytosine-specific restriction endonuclease McrA
LNNYLKTSTKLSGQSILYKLVHSNTKKYECEICKINKWQNEALVLELHHIDENHKNNDLDNLQILCPNCHRQQHISLDVLNMNKHLINKKS